MLCLSKHNVICLSDKIKTKMKFLLWSLFITEQGHVYSCGWGADGQLGLGHYQTEWKPTQVGGDILSERIVKVVGSGDCVLALSGEYRYSVYTTTSVFVLLFWQA